MDTPMRAYRWLYRVVFIRIDYARTAGDARGPETPLPVLADVTRAEPAKEEP